MSKLISEHDNPIDNLITDYFVIPLTPCLRKMGFTPNAVTVLSITLAFASIYFLEKKNTILFTFLFSIAFILDCIDGYMARTYNMTSKLGDFLDHIGDAFKFGMLFASSICEYLI